MNLDLLKERLSNIETDLKAQHKQLEQIVANINLLNGSKMECERWIEEFCKDLNLNRCNLAAVKEVTENTAVLN